MPMNGQPMLPKWPNDGSSHMFGRNRESRRREADGRRNLARSRVQENERQKKGIYRNQ